MAKKHRIYFRWDRKCLIEAARKPWAKKIWIFLFVNYRFCRIPEAMSRAPRSTPPARHRIYTHGFGVQNFMYTFAHFCVRKFCTNMRKIGREECERERASTCLCGSPVRGRLCNSPSVRPGYTRANRRAYTVSSSARRGLVKSKTPKRFQGIHKARTHCSTN